MASLLPVDVQMREDAALGAAWRRAMAIPGWALCYVMRRMSSGAHQWAAIGCPERTDGTWVFSKSRNGFGDTPAAALDDLVAKIGAYERRTV